MRFIRRMRLNKKVLGNDRTEYKWSFSGIRCQLPRLKQQWGWT